MEYIRDVANANNDPLVIDYPIEADTVKQGEVMALGLTDGNDLNFAVSAEGAQGTDHDYIIGVMNEGLTSTLDIDTASTYKASNFGKMTVNPFGVFSAKYSQSTSDDLTMNGDLTFACTSSKGMPYLGGSFLYVISGTGAGELHLIEDSSTSSTTCTIVLSNAGATTLDATSNFIIIFGAGQHCVSLGDVDIVQDKDADYDSDISTGTYGMGVNILKSKIQTDTIGRRVLMSGDKFGQGTDAGRTGLNNANVKFYSEIVFGGVSHALACSSGITRTS